MIVYFTGTGNSKYIAEYMAESLEDETFDAAKQIKKEKVRIFIPKNRGFLWHLPMDGSFLICFCNFLGRVPLQARKKHILL